MADVEPLAFTATGLGTSTGTTTLAVTSVTGKILPGSTITGAGVPAGTKVVSGPAGGGAGSYITSVATTLTNVPLTFIADPTISYFPEFVPIVPPPLIGQGGGPPPTFPPPTPPPIGQIPAGVLVGPAIAPAAVPPSVAGITQPIYKYGSATTPPASAAFPEFTTASPSPPIVFSNIYTGGATPVHPPSTTTPTYIPVGTAMGPPIGPALPNPIPPRQFMAPMV